MEPKNNNDDRNSVHMASRMIAKGLSESFLVSKKNFDDEETSTNVISKVLSDSFRVHKKGATIEEEEVPDADLTESDEDGPVQHINSTSEEQYLDQPINDLSTFEAAVEDIRTVLSVKGSISAIGIANVINRSNKVVALTRRHFPAAQASTDIVSNVMKTLRDFNVTAENTLFTHSVCPDEINHWDGHIIDKFIKGLGGGRAFELGGLAGIPFTGKTGFAAFSHHVPDGGHAFILQAAHIGISNSLELGQYTREGQSADGSACGAAVGALCHCASGKPIPDLADPSSGCDYQMSYIINEVSKCIGEIDDAYAQSKDENARQAALAKETHRIGKEMLNKIVSTDFGCDQSMLFILSGVQINMPYDFCDYFEPLGFEVRKSDGTIIDLYKQTFGKKM